MPIVQDNENPESATAGDRRLDEEPDLLAGRVLGCFVSAVGRT